MVILGFHVKLRASIFLIPLETGHIDSCWWPSLRMQQEGDYSQNHAMETSSKLRISPIASLIPRSLTMVWQLHEKLEKNRIQSQHLIYFDPFPLIFVIFWALLCLQTSCFTLISVGFLTF